MVLQVAENSDFIYGRDLILLQKYAGELSEKQEILKLLGHVPQGSVYTRKTTVKYKTNNNEIHKYPNYIQELYINGKIYHIPRKVKRYCEADLFKKYGKNFNLQDYSFKENIVFAKSKIELRDTILEDIDYLKKKISRLQNNINIHKTKFQNEITDNYIDLLGKQYADIKKHLIVYAREKEHKIDVARTGTVDEIKAEFASVAQRNFYAVDGRKIKTYAGETVRSKNELIVANIMKRIGILYMYEYFVQETGQNCDFVFWTGCKMYYLEILGMMENEQYRQRWENKEKLYNRAGLISGEKLFVLNISNYNDLDEQKIEQLFFDIAARSTTIDK